jgi:hypothetical protein
MKMERETDTIYAEQYIEVEATGDLYIVKLVIESLIDDGICSLKFGSYDSLDEAEDMAEGLRYVYDRMITGDDFL